jgi:O-antigen/teichoic acid export membrane protein
MFVEAFSVMFIPMISAYYEKQDVPGLESAFQTIAKWSLTLSLPIFAGFALLHREVLGVYGEAYQAGGACLILLCGGYIFHAASGPAGSIVTMSGRSWLTLANTFGAVALNILLNAFLIPRQGIRGAALATAISMVALNLLRLVQVRTLLGVRPYRLAILKPLLAAGVAGTAVWVAGGWIARLPILLGLAAGGTLLAAIYLLVLTALGFDPEDRFILRRVRSRLTALQG